MAFQGDLDSMNLPNIRACRGSRMIWTTINNNNCTHLYTFIYTRTSQIEVFLAYDENN